MQIGKILGLGRSSEVYEYGIDKVLKLYFKEHAYDTVKWEYDKLSNAKDNNVPVPAVYELIEHDGRFGIIMERIYGESLLEIIVEHIITTGGENIAANGVSDLIIEITKGMAQLLYFVHSIKADLTDKSKDIITRAVHYNNHITEDEKAIVLNILDSLPTGDTVCHGDPNYGNVLVSGKKGAFIDWMFVGTGYPMYDIAEYIMTTRYFTIEPKNKQVIEFMEKYGEEMINIFLSEYSEISDLKITDVDKWLIPLMVNRLNGGGSEEYKQRLLTDIREKICLHC
ncbi:MAG: phosphotransferase [Oscillospiraceae bacterium]|nr:phosphotransferase [Oscillospiraceae bacterium]